MHLFPWGWVPRSWVSLRPYLHSSRDSGKYEVCFQKWTVMFCSISEQFIIHRVSSRSLETNFFFSVPQSMWDLYSPTRDQTRAPCIRIIESWTAREVRTQAWFWIPIYLLAVWPWASCLWASSSLICEMGIMISTWQDSMGSKWKGGESNTKPSSGKTGLQKYQFFFHVLNIMLDIFPKKLHFGNLAFDCFCISRKQHLCVCLCMPMHTCIFFSSAEREKVKVSLLCMWVCLCVFPCLSRRSQENESVKPDSDHCLLLKKIPAT